MKKKTFAFSLAFCVCIIAVCAGVEYSIPRVKIDGVFLQSEVVMKDDKIYVPIRAVFDEIGATVEWDESDKIAYITTKNEDHKIADAIKEVSKSVVAIIGNYIDASDFQAVGTQITAHGTGVVIKSGGEIITNAHVVKNLEQIVVVMSDGSGYQAKLKYIDEAMDLAVIKIDKIGLIPIKFAKYEDIVVGQTAIAIGTPISFSLRNSASKGIVSGMNCQFFSDYRLIQTDAAINPGNSGGPLVNINGELIGINSSKYAAVGIEGMGFTIPVDTVKYAINQFDKYGKIRRPNTGLTYEESWTSKLGLPSKEGLTITKIEEKSESIKAGIMIGDSLIYVGKSEIHSITDLNEAMKNYNIGDLMDFIVLRSGEKLTVNILSVE